jgi:hypothetical protein
MVIVLKKMDMVEKIFVDVEDVDVMLAGSVVLMALKV